MIRLVALALVLTACAAGGESATHRYLALGDSYTIGEGVTAAERWPEVLAEALETQGFGTFSVQVVAQTGWSVAELDAGIDAAAPEGPFDLVTLLIGVNDQFRGTPLAEYEVAFTALLDRAIGFGGGDPARVVVVSIPDWGATPSAVGLDTERIAAEIDAFNAAARTITQEAGAAWVDVTGISRSGLPGLVVADLLHPSPGHYRLWVEAILPEARQAVAG